MARNFCTKPSLCAASACLSASASMTEDGLLFHLGEQLNWFQRLRHRHCTETPSQTSDDAGYALSIHDLSFAYSSQTVLHGVSLNVAPGEICGLLGPNGCGKTTLFRCCMGFLHPQQGQVRVRGVNIAHRRPAELARHVAYVPQEHRQPFPFTVRDMVLMGRSPHMGGWFRLSRDDAYIAEEAMERIGIAALADRTCNQLSGGQRQLVLIARAMAQQTPLILLDEPTSALDFSNQLAVWNALREVADQGVAVLVCCHDPNHILWFCHRAAVLHKGRVAAEGAARDVITQDMLQRLYGPQCVRIEAGTSGMVCPKSCAGPSR